MPQAGDPLSQVRERSSLYCLVSPLLSLPLLARLENLVAAHRVSILTERRHVERRRHDERRTADAPPAATAASEQRRIHHQEGRRVGERRAALVPVVAPVELPASILRHEGAVTFLERREPSAQQREDLQSARLVIDIQAGEPHAFEELYELYLARVYGYMRVALHDPHEAEDAAHEIFVRLLEALPNYEVRTVPFRIWLFRVVRHYTINYLQKHRRIEVMEPGRVNRRVELEGAGLDPEALGSLDDSELLRAIQYLPLPQQQVIMLRYIFGFDINEVAKILGRTPNAVSQLHRRAFALLRARLAPYAEGAETATVRFPMRMRLSDARVLHSRRFALGAF